MTKTIFFFAIIFSIISCSQNYKKHERKIVIHRGPYYQNLNNIKDINHAPLAINKAAWAVVALEHGTGFFVKYDNQTFLATNHHVIGEDKCFIGGCYEEVKLFFQKDVQFTTDNTVTLKLIPYYMNKDIDVSLFTFSNPDIPTWSPPKILKFKKSSANEQIGQNIHIVGHPNLTVKKWIQGPVISAREKEKDVTSATIVAPGSSGSPVLNNIGEVIGITHSGTTPIRSAFSHSEKVFSVSWHTPSEELLRELDEGKNIVQFEVFKKESPLDTLISRSYLFLKARIKPTLPDDLNIYDELEKKCAYEIQKAQKQQAKDIDDLQNLTRSCLFAFDWLDCREDSKLKDFRFCPKDSLELWKSYLDDYIEMLSKFPDSHSEFSRVNVLAATGDNIEHGRHLALVSLKDKAINKKQELDFIYATTINILANDKTDLFYNNISTVDFIVDYRHQREYWNHFEVISTSVYYLALNRFLDQDHVEHLFDELLQEKNLTIMNKWYLEKLVYLLNSKHPGPPKRSII